MSGVIQKYDRTEQLFDLTAKDTSRGYIVDCYLYSDGTIATDKSGYQISEYIPIESETSYALNYGSSLNLPSICFYDSSYNYISGIQYARVIPIIFQTPSNAAYCRFSMERVLENAVMFNKGSSSLSYQPYLAFKDIPYTRLETATDTITALPKTIYTDTTSIPSANLLNPASTVEVNGNTYHGQIFPAGNYYIKDTNQFGSVIYRDMDTQYDIILVDGSDATVTSSGDLLVYTSVDWAKYMTKVMAAKSSEAVPFTPYVGDYTIKGNMSQSGTPTPTSPITPSECGERTSNLFDKNNYIDTSGYYVGNETTLRTANTVVSMIIPIEGGKSYTLKSTGYTNRFTCGFVKTLTPSVGVPVYSQSTAISSLIYRGTADADVVGLFVYYAKTDTVDTPTTAQIEELINNMQLVEGSYTTETIPPYEPYGYKIPIVSDNITTNIYLKEPLRKIGDYADTITSDGMVTRNIVSVDLSSYTFTYNTQTTVWSCNTLPNIKYSSSGSTLGLGVAEKYVNHTASGLYAAVNNFAIGTNTVGVNTGSDSIEPSGKLWYVLTTPTTETITAPSIPMTSGGQTFDVSTTLKPSEVDLTYHGWHEHEAEKYTLLLPNNPLCGISTYKDTLNLATGACTRQIKKVVLTGEEDWGKSGNFDNVNRFYLTQADGGQSGVAYSSHFRYDTGDADNVHIRFAVATTRIYIYADKNIMTSTAVFTQWLADQYANGTPVTVYYVLATPTTETVTVPSGLSGTEEGYLTRSKTPTPTNPVYPTANNVPVWE